MKHNIENYQLTANSILVYAIESNNEEAVENKIDRKRFEDFLDETGKLDWIMDYSEAGEHRQISGKMDLTEYWESGHYDVIHSDLEEFMKSELKVA